MRSGKPGVINFTKRFRSRDSLTTESKGVLLRREGIRNSNDVELNASGHFQLSLLYLEGPANKTFSCFYLKVKPSFTGPSLFMLLHMRISLPQQHSTATSVSLLSINRVLLQNFGRQSSYTEYVSMSLKRINKGEAIVACRFSEEMVFLCRVLAGASDRRRTTVLR